MDAEAFDTELFIGEVEKRRCIWDMECKDYKNRVLKNSAWQEIVDIFAEENSTKEQKTVLGNTLQKKWDHFRDNYARQLKKQKTLKSGSGASKSNPYIFFKRLQFLQPTITNKTVTDNLDNSNQLEEETELQDVHLLSDEPSAVDRNVNRNKKFKMNPVDKQFKDVLNKSVALREQRPTEVPKEDDDKLFCLSLYTELQQVPGHGRLRTKIQLSEVLQRAQEFYNPSSIHHPAPQSYHSYQANSGRAPPQTFNQFDYGSNLQRNQRPLLQESSSEHIGYSSQSAAAAAVNTPYSQSVLAGAALSPTDSSILQANSDFSDIHN